MTGATAAFFDALSQRGHEPMLLRLDATLRWDILDGDQVEYRLVRIDHGDIQVSLSDGPADCVITAERAVCDDVVGGRTSALAALLRGAVSIQGDAELMVLAQRLLSREPAAACDRNHLPEGSEPDG